MDSYEALMNNPMASNYHMTHHSNFPQFPDNGGIGSSYGHLGDLSSSYHADSARATAGSIVGLRGSYSTPQQPMSYGSLPPHSSASFSMPYDPPHMQQPQQQQAQADSGGGGGGSSGGVTHSHSIQMPPLTPVSHSTSVPAPTKTVHSCTYCGLVLSSANALIEHKRIHTGDRPFACHICGKRFTQKAHLNIHKRTHTGEKPYACHICNKRFAQSSHLVSHKRIHTGEKPFVCGICHIGFTQKQRLDAHLKKHLAQGGPEQLARIMSAGGKMDHPYRGRPSHTDENFMTMMNHNMPYIKQEVGPNDEEEADHRKFSVNGKASASGEGQMGPGSGVNDSDGAKEEVSDDEAEGKENEGGGGTQKNASESDKISAPSFSSEGMFLHPSGYVAYGGIEDNEEPGYQSQGFHPSESGNQQGASRRKPAVVRKLPMESASSSEQANSKQSDGINQFHRFSPLHNGPEPGIHGTGDIEEIQDVGESVDDKNDPPYHSNSSCKPSTPGMTTRRASMPQHDQETSYANRRHLNNTGSPYPFPAANGIDREANAVPQETFSYSSPRNSADSGPSLGGGGSGGLVKVNNRVSLVNFTAEELLNHLMKRDDIHKCQFCCLIFQDAAMYHIHRNMHDRTDPRRCNLCGKMLADKYDFTAHFLSMHKN